MGDGDMKPGKRWHGELVEMDDYQRRTLSVLIFIKGGESQDDTLLFYFVA